MQDEKSVTEEFQTYYNDNNIYLHVEGKNSTNVKENRYTIINKNLIFIDRFQ